MWLKVALSQPAMHLPFIYNEIFMRRNGDDNTIYIILAMEKMDHINKGSTCMKNSFRQSEAQNFKPLS